MQDMQLPKPETIVELVEQAVKCFADRPAVIEDEITLSFDELGDLCHSAARSFIALGLNKGDRVAIWAPNIYEWVVATLGLQLAGGVLVPINTRLKGSEAAYIMNASQVRFLCTVSGFLDIDYIELLADQDVPRLEQTVFLRGESTGGISWRNFLAMGAEISEADRRTRSENIGPDDALDILFTSGTTGNPKGVISSHKKNLQVYMAWGERIGIVPDDRYLIINPFYHTFGYKAGWLTCLLFGAAILPAITFDVKTVMETIERAKVSVMPGPPTIFQRLLSDTRRKNYDLSSLRMITTGATTVPVTLVDRIRDDLGIKDVRTAYGLTESCGVVSVSLKQDSSEKVANTSGYPIPGIEVQCVDSEGNPLPAGQAGEIWVRGYNVMNSYLDNPAATAETVDQQGWLHTGDVGVLDNEGYLQITDRLKDMFIVGGFNCYPAEVERQLSTLPGVDQVAVVGSSDESLGEVGHAFIVNGQDSDLNEEGVVSWCKETMANYKVPRYVSFVAELPRNSLGKVMKNSLKALSKASRASV